MIFSHIFGDKVSFVNAAVEAEIDVNQSAMEAAMSACTPQTMTNHHDSTFFGQLGETWRTWHRRFVERHELANWTDRDLSDVGLSWDDVAQEIEKPFWRD
jgi:uncharacterized protein YjiS (DUF1127 family)